jgi:hypothetical protein
MENSTPANISGNDECSRKDPRKIQERSRKEM